MELDLVRDGEMEPSVVADWKSVVVAVEGVDDE